MSLPLPSTSAIPGIPAQIRIALPAKLGAREREHLTAEPTSADLWEGFPCAVVVHRPSGTVKYANAHAYDMMRATERPGQRRSLLPVGSKLLGDDGKPAKRLAPMVQKLREPIIGVPFTLVRPDGDVIRQTASCIPLIDRRGSHMYQLTSVAERSESQLLQELLAWLRNDWVQSTLAVVLSLSAVHGKARPQEVHDAIGLAIETLRDSAAQVLGRIGRSPADAPELALRARSLSGGLTARTAGSSCR